MADPALVRSLADKWRVAPGGIRKELEELENLPLSYACGDLLGGSFYAQRGWGVPVVVEIEIPWETMRVDGRDFLFTVFTIWDRHGSSHRNRVRNTLATLFGPAILGYFDDANGDFDMRIGLCDLAIHDIDVIRCHYANDIELQGRFCTRFCHRKGARSYSALCDTQ
jgi:hypothetical protein